MSPNMPRQYVRRKTRGSHDPDLPAAIVAFLFDDPLPDDVDPFLSLNLRFPIAGEPVWNSQSLEAIWRDYGAEVITEWIADKPGTRPALWWRYIAPEPRQRIGGTGTPSHEALANAPILAYGVPLSWISAEDVRLLKLRCEALDDADPPTFESQASFLARYKLFLPGERRRLAPDAFEPVPLPEIGER
jgi:hypothetical protein